MFALVVTCLALAWISFFARFCSKILYGRKLRRDDWLLLPSMIFFCGACGCLIVIDPVCANLWAGTLSNKLHVELASYKLVLMSSIFLKASLAVALARLFGRSWQRWFIIVITILYAIYTISLLIFTLFFCGLPTTFALKTTVYECPRWRYAENMIFASAIINTATDWIYILLPIATIWRSNLSKAAKVAILVITVIGALSSIAAVVRAVYSSTIITDPSLNTPTTIAITCTIIELCLGIVAVSLVGSTALLGLFGCSDKVRASTPGDENNMPTGDQSNIIKLSPIIFQKAQADLSTANLSKTTSSTSGREGLMVPVLTAKKANRFSWSRTFGAPGASNPAMGNITLLIDDITDDEEDSIPSASHEKKKSFSHV